MNAPDALALPGAAIQATSAYTISVRGLCEFAAKHGDLDLRFTPSPTSQQGIEGHRSLQLNRGEGYRSEVPLQGEYANLVVRGRADGYDARRRLVEEIKTCVGDPASTPDNHRRLHWAQAKVYGALLCRQHELPSITVTLVYFDVREQREFPPLVEEHAAVDLQAFFAELCERFLGWARAEAGHRAGRDASLAALGFPHPTFRTGQRDLAKTAFNAARSRSCLLAQAPTGIGKTLATIFPLLKACPREAIDRICFLTAKGSGKALALSALQLLHRAHPDLRLRTLELSARDKSCEHPDKSCHPESCPLARGFYDRLPAARADAAGCPLLTKEALRRIALTHSVCPYYLAQEMARWSDVIVADYNHWFDRSALLHVLALDNDLRVALLIDEAHNLVDRARAMYSASLDSERIRSALAVAPYRIAKSLQRLRKTWSRLARAMPTSYAVLPEPPEALQLALQDVTGTIAEHFADEPRHTNAALLDFHFEALALLRAVETHAEHSLFETRVHEVSSPTSSRRRIDARFAVTNVVPAVFLRPRFEAAHCAVLFSATLSPWQFYENTLGLPESTCRADIPTPFRPEQLTVRIVADVSTRYRDRGRSIEPIVRLVERSYGDAPGNYLVFASSFDYMDQLADEFAARCPDIPTWRQSRRMDDDDRDGFLRRFEPEGRGIAFAVLGGVFAEGIDLVGTRLVGVFIATLGLPQVNDTNEAMRQRIDEIGGPGQDYVYLYPGLRKVVQAAGRVIRTETDRGSIWLIDDRYTRPDVRRLLPSWWNVTVVRSTDDETTRAP